MQTQVEKYVRTINTNDGQVTWEFRVGDTVENIETGSRGIIAELREQDFKPSYAGEIVTGTPCYVRFVGYGACCVLVIRPTLPERIRESRCPHMFPTDSCVYC